MLYNIFYYIITNFNLILSLINGGIFLNNDERPNIKIPLSWKDKTLILTATILFVFILLYLKMVWSDIPEVIPTHFGFSGAPDRFGSKSSLFIIIIIGAGIHILLSFLSKIPKFYNYPVSVTEKNAEVLYKIGRQLILLIDLEASVLINVLAWNDIQVALGKMHGVAPEMFMIIGIIFFTIIYETVRMVKAK